MKNHQNNSAYREACRRAVDQAYKDAGAGLKEARKVFADAKAVGRDGTKQRLKTATEALEAIIVTSNESLEKNKIVVAAVKRRYRPGTESSDDDRC